MDEGEEVGEWAEGMEVVEEEDKIADDGLDDGMGHDVHGHGM